ncbi:recombinase family protein [Nonomuraea sp. NPDC051941]|uniref:recombinase family protein n=1 Tax=Nonomuraea sp. NPDC051941 TaxID=3364373 RepID=UPI0037C6E4E3
MAAGRHRRGLPQLHLIGQPERPAHMPGHSHWHLSDLREVSQPLLRAGVDRDNIHLDKASGAKASRPEFDLVLQLLREGDTLKVTRLDRLSRSVLHLVTLSAELRERKIGLHVIEQGIDTSTVEGRAMFGMLSVLAELQRELIVANTMDGLASARSRGRVGGRRPKLSEDQAALAQQLYDARDKTVQQIADLFGVPRSTVYGHLKGDTVPPPAKEDPGQGVVGARGRCSEPGARLVPGVVFDMPPECP